VILEYYKLKIKVITLASVFLIGYIDLCEVNNVFNKVYDISNCWSHRGVHLGAEETLVTLIDFFCVSLLAKREVTYTDKQLFSCTSSRRMHSSQRMYKS
jgi:hypothetical protein